MRWLFPLLALALLATVSAAQQVEQSVLFSATELPHSAPSDYPILRSTESGWFRSKGGDYWLWYHKRACVGRYFHITDTWQSWDGRRWGPEMAPPWQRPDTMPGAKKQADGAINFGLDVGKLQQQGERFMRGDEPVGKQEVMQNLIGNNFKDDSATPYVTVIDPNDARRQQTVQQLRAQLGDRARVCDYNPSWTGQKTIALDGFRLEQDQQYQQTQQAVLVQAPPDKDGFGNPTGFGQVQQAHYGPVGAETVAAIGRVANPNYDPKDNPGGGAGITLNWSWILKNIVWPIIIMLFGGTVGGVVVRAKMSGGAAPPNEPAAPRKPSYLVALLEALKEVKAERQAREEAAKAQAEEKLLVKELAAELSA